MKILIESGDHSFSDAMLANYRVFLKTRRDKVLFWVKPLSFVYSISRQAKFFENSLSNNLLFVTTLLLTPVYLYYHLVKNTSQLVGEILKKKRTASDDRETFFPRYSISNTKTKKKKNVRHNVENPGIDPGTSRMLSERSTMWANSPSLQVENQHINLTVFFPKVVPSLMTRKRCLQT